VTCEETTHEPSIASKNIPTKKELGMNMTGVFIVHQNLKTQNATLGKFVRARKASTGPL
jgi:hypothetical protein